MLEGEEEGALVGVVVGDVEVGEAAVGETVVVAMVVGDYHGYNYKVGLAVGPAVGLILREGVGPAVWVIGGEDVGPAVGLIGASVGPVVRLIEGESVAGIGVVGEGNLGLI